MNIQSMTLLERFAMAAEKNSRIRAELEAQEETKTDPDEIRKDPGRRTKRTGIYTGKAREMSTQELLEFMRGAAE